MTALVGIIAVAQASSFLERPFPESVKDAPVIVRGKVGATSTDWGGERDGGKRIFTYWDVQVGEVLKGVADQRNGALKIREMGGEKDGVGMQVSGAASFNPGEEVVIFLGERNSEGTHDVWGMMMGKYSLRKDARGQEVLEGPGLSGDAHAHTSGSLPAESWTIPALRRLIASQGDAPRAPTPAPTASAAPSVRTPVVIQALATPSPAPQLHDSAIRTRSAESGSPAPWLAFGAVGLIGAAGYFVLGRKR